MPAMTFACIAVLAVVGLAIYAIHRKASLKVTAKAPGKFEVNIEVGSQSGLHHGQMPGEPTGSPRSLDQPDNPVQASKSRAIRRVVLPPSLFEHPAAELSGDDSAGLRGHHREPEHVA